MGNPPWVICLEMMTRRSPPSDSESDSSSIINDTVVLPEPTSPVSKNPTNNNNTPLVPYTDSEQTVSLPSTKGEKE